MKLPPVYAITRGDASDAGSVRDDARRLLRVGVRAIQVRERALPDRELLACAEAVAGDGRAVRAAVLVNDRVDVARLAGAGVHLGEDDLPAAHARAILGPGAIVGVSTHDEEAAWRAFGDPAADYVAFGPVFHSPTKAGRSARGLSALARAAAGKTKPLVAIGGVTPDKLDEVWNAGADSAAMIGGLYAGGRIEDNARRALDLGRRRRRPGRIYLVGFMGSGKSTVGRRLAERLSMPFVDLDDEIERTSGKTIRALFEQSGEEAFRLREAAFLEGTESLPAAVIATGGGCFAQEANRRRIARLGTSVFLDASLAAVRERLRGKTDRPLFQTPEQLAGLFAAREPFYRMARVCVNLAGTESIDEVADRVLIALDDAKTPPLEKDACAT